MSEITETLYIESASNLRDKLERIDNIIEALELQMLNVGAGNSSTQSYSVDDGQVKINTQYSTPKAMADGLIAFETIRQRILNKLNGRGMVLRPWRGLI